MNWAMQYKRSDRIILVHLLQYLSNLREDHWKQLELEEARKAGLVPAEVDEDGK